MIESMEQSVLLPESLGKALRAARKKKKMTQTQVGKIVGIEQHTVSKLEAGRIGVSLGTLFRVLSALELELVVRPRQKVVSGGDEW